MARPKILDQDFHKFTLDLSGDNKIAIDGITQNFQMKYGPFINLLIKSICRMTPRMKNAFIEFCKSKCDEINAQIKVAGEREKKDLEEEKGKYLEIARIINGGLEIEYNNDDPTMRKIALKDGMLIIPKDWIVLNEEDAANCRFAGCVECRNSQKLGIPHFCFFANHQYACDYDDQFIESINESCCKKWPQFQEILHKQVKPIPDPDHRGKYLNTEEYLAAPIIGHFHIVCDDDELFDGHPPYGAMILRSALKNNV